MNAWVGRRPYGFIPQHLKDMIGASAQVGGPASLIAPDIFDCYYPQGHMTSRAFCPFSLVHHWCMILEETMVE